MTVWLVPSVLLIDQPRQLISYIFQDMLAMLLRDGGLPHEMDITSARGINLTMLVLSLLDCMCNNQQVSDLNPLSELINQPMQAAQHFLPTMMDNQYELMAEDIRIALQRTGDNPVAYSESIPIASLGFNKSVEIKVVF